MRNIRKIISLLTIIITTVVSVWIWQEQASEPSRGAVSDVTIEVPPGFVLVDRIVDGDTFEITLDGKKEKVRMIGIDTPESVDPRRPVQCFGKEATKKLEEIIGGKPVRLEIDPKSNTRDKYHRLLRHVYTEDGIHINARMIEEGYAYAYTQFAFELRSQFLKLQTAAREAGRGLWAQTACSGRR